LSYDSARRFFYHWLRNPTPSAFFFRYTAHPSSVTDSLLKQFVAICQKPSIGSLLDAFRELKRHRRVRVTYAAFVRRVPPAQRIALRGLHRLRKVQRQEMQRAMERIQKA
jgi:hypothetical protein